MLEGIEWERFGEVAQSTSPFRALSMSGSGDRVVVAEIGRIQVFQYSPQQQVWSTLGGGSTIELSMPVSVTMSRDGNTVAYGSFVDGGSVRGGKSSFVKLLRFNGTDWTPLGQPLSGACAFANSVAVSDNGRRVAVGDPLFNQNRGLVTVYELELWGDQWIQMGAPIHGSSSGDYAGASVSLSGSGLTVAVGSPGSSINILNGGLVRVFSYDQANGWARLGQVLSGQFRQKQFGYAVSLSRDGRRVAVGAPFFEPFGIGEGTVYVYELLPASPSQQRQEQQQHLFQQQQDPSSSSSLYFWQMLGSVIRGTHFGDSAGISLDMSANGQTVALGAPGRDNMRVMALIRGEWTQVGLIQDRSMENFGISVCLSETGRVLAVGGASSNPRSEATTNAQMFFRADNVAL